MKKIVYQIKWSIVIACVWFGLLAFLAKIQVNQHTVIIWSWLVHSDWKLLIGSTIPIVLIIVLRQLVHLWRYLSYLFRLRPFSTATDSSFLAIVVSSCLYGLGTKNKLFPPVFQIPIWMRIGIIILIAIYVLVLIIRFLDSTLEKQTIKDPLVMDTDNPKIKESDDLLDRKIFVDQILRSLQSYNKSDSLVIGLYARWGSGKSTVLHFIKNRLKNDKNFIVVEFDPWHFKDEHELIRQFFQHLKSSILEDGTISNRKLIRRINQYTYSVSQIKLGGIWDKLSPYSIQDLVNVLNGTRSYYQNAAISDLRSDISDILEQSRKRVLIFIDNLDRLNKDEIHAVFKIVKLIADFKNTSYLLAFDNHMVVQSLADKYIGEGKEMNGYSYLEKIVHVPLYLPNADAHVIKKVAISGAREILKAFSVDSLDNELERISETWDRTIGDSAPTLRLVNRFLNSYRFSLPTIINEVDNRDLFFIELLKVVFPKVYEFIRQNPEYFLLYDTDLDEDQNKQIGEEINSLVNNYPEIARLSIKRVLTTLFPQAGQRITGIQEEDFKIRQQLYGKNLVAVREYFSIYFNYRFTGNQIQDMEIRDLVRSLSEVGNDRNDSLVKAQLLADRAGEDRLFEKLIWNLNCYNSDQKVSLADFLMYNGESLFYDSLNKNWKVSAKRIATFVVELLNSGLADIPKEAKHILSFFQSFAPFQLLLPLYQHNFSIRYAFDDETQALFTDITSEFLQRIKMEFEQVTVAFNYRQFSYCLDLMKDNNQSLKPFYNNWLLKWDTCEHLLVTMVMGNFQIEFTERHLLKLVYLFESNLDDLANKLSEIIRIPQTEDEYVRAREKGSTEGIIEQFLYLHHKVTSMQNQICEEIALRIFNDDEKDQLKQMARNLFTITSLRKMDFLVKNRDFMEINLEFKVLQIEQDKILGSDSATTVKITEI